MKERTGNWKYQAIELTEACCETIATILNNSIIEKTAVNSRTIRHSHISYRLNWFLVGIDGMV